MAAVDIVEDPPGVDISGNGHRGGERKRKMLCAVVHIPRMKVYCAS